MSEHGKRPSEDSNYRRIAHALGAVTVAAVYGDSGLVEAAQILAEKADEAEHWLRLVDRELWPERRKLMAMRAGAFRDSFRAIYKRAVDGIGGYCWEDAETVARLYPEERDLSGLIALAAAFRREEKVT